ncbi:MAG: DUF2059 domain-containing protein [Bacteroidota bacterium]
MKNIFGLFALFFGVLTTTSAQSDSAIKEKYLSVFNRMAKEAKEFKPDTSLAPPDKITKKIIELRNLRGGFNINEVVDFKLEEDKLKGDITGPAATAFSAFMKTGYGKKWLDNAVIWIYRRHFTFKELKHLVRFYKTPAGRKMADELPVTIIQSVMAAEMIKDIYSKQHTKK